MTDWLVGENEAWAPERIGIRGNDYDGAALEHAGRRPGVERYTQFSRAFHDFLHDKFESVAKPDLDGFDAVLRDAIEGR